MVALAHNKCVLCKGRPAGAPYWQIAATEARALLEISPHDEVADVPRVTDRPRMDGLCMGLTSKNFAVMERRG